ncbi:P-loop ATPase, Sll1717 family [uncultured Oscillibacter sp.]|uniref:P-loop ATPase, Sll1717 family n=1 Tax=uncultured Oscillibacter sp. TaxID=876091 RepID=UPI0025D57E34|nr:hypothetical protein [uncultured Oscillibacter sp.]
MNEIAIQDIYAGMPDAKDEITTNQADKFFASFIVPPGLPLNSLLNGKKFLVTGYKGVGKTSILFYLQNRTQEQDPLTCTSFLYFKSDFEEVKKSNIDAVAKRLSSLIDISGDIQPNKIEYLHIWRWVFFKKIADDCAENQGGLFKQDTNWHDFVKEVNRISFSSSSKKTIVLSELGISLNSSPISGTSLNANASFQRIANDYSAFNELIETVDRCEALFRKLERTDIPYYLFVDEMEAYYGNQELFKRDLTLIRDMIFTIHRLNGYGKVRIIAAIRNEIVFAMDRFIQTKEINKIIDGYSVPIKWTYNNTNSIEHPIIKVLMKRIEVGSGGKPQSFWDWFPRRIYNRDAVSYILDNGWNKPRDIVRLITAAQNDSVHCEDTSFTRAAFDNLRKEYSKGSLAEVRQELQSLYTTQEIEMVIRLLRGGPKFTTADEIRKRTAKGSSARDFWDKRSEDILEDFYRVGLWGNINRKGAYSWRWNHKGDSGVLKDNGWELAIHPALYSELSITFY